MLQQPRGPVYVAHAASGATAVGFVGGAEITAGDLVVHCQPFGLNFAAISAVSLTDAPLRDSHRVLVTLAARAENTEMNWNAWRTSAGDIWGKGGSPVAERVPAQVRLRTNGERRVFALNPDGSRARAITAAYENGWLVFTTTEGPATLHYEVIL
jgi:hypothetical protein